jgi:O-antigen/teichoic acid export membrane protein
MEIFKKVFHQLSWQMGAKVISASSTIFLLSIITRSFGEDGTGVYTLALTYLAFFYLAADLGLNGFYLSNYRDDPLLANKIYNFRLGWSFVLFLGAVFILPLLPFATTDFILTVLIGGLTIVLNGLFNSTNFVFQHHLAYSKSSQALAAGSVVSLTVAYILSIWGVPIYYFSLAPLLGWMVTVGICYLAVRNFYIFRLTKPDWFFPVETLRTAWPVAATLVVNTLYFRIDSFILSSTQTFATVGAYNLAYQIFQNILVIPAFIMNGYYPLMLKSIKDNPAVFRSHFKKAIFLMIFLGVFGFLSLFYLADFFIAVLTGKGFDGAVTTLHILATSLPAFFLSALLMWLMMAKKLYKTLLMVYLTAFLVNFLANWYFIPVYSYIAASWVTVASEYLILLLQVLILYRYRK